MTALTGEEWLVANIVSSPVSVPKNAGGKRPDTSPVVSRAANQQRGQLAKSNQALQVPAVALYPSRKKVPVKDLPPFGKFEIEAIKRFGIIYFPIVAYWFGLLILDDGVWCEMYSIVKWRGKAGCVNVSL